MDTLQDTQAYAIKPRGYELRVSLLFTAVFLSTGVHLPYFPLWLEYSGFRPAEIAVILSAPMFLRVATTPVITAYADRARDRVNVLVFCSIAALLLSFGYLLPPSYVLVLAVSLALAVFWSPQAILADSLALSGVRRYGSDYSRMRLWGSAAFLAANVAGGQVLGLTGVGAVPVLICVGMALALAVSLAAPRLGRPRVASPLSADAMKRGGASTFLDRRFVLFLTGVGLINGSHGLLYAFGSIHWKALGIGETMIGLLWAWGVCAEVAMFVVFTRIFGRISPQRLMIMAAGAAVVRWTAFTVWDGSAIGIAAFFLLQTLHAMSIGFVLIGVQKMIADRVDEAYLNSAQGAVFFANGGAMAAITLVSGPIYATFGASGFHAMSVVAAAGAVLVWLSARQPQRPGSAG